MDMLDTLPFESFAKIHRFNREWIVTEKLDGTNAQICITDDGANMLVGSRNRWITPQDDNYGFARWADENKEELLKLGPGRHYGEWWGQGIARRYGLTEKRFSLFNVYRWKESRPSCCHVVPVLVTGNNASLCRDQALDILRCEGSKAAPGFMKPEGIVMFHVPSQALFKVTLEGDETGKGEG